MRNSKAFALLRQHYPESTIAISIQREQWCHGFGKRQTAGYKVSLVTGFIVSASNASLHLAVQQLIADKSVNRIVLLGTAGL